MSLFFCFFLQVYTLTCLLHIEFIEQTHAYQEIFIFVFCAHVLVSDSLLQKHSCSLYTLWLAIPHTNLFMCMVRVVISVQSPLFTYVLVFVVVFSLLCVCVCVCVCGEKGWGDLDGGSGLFGVYIGQV